MKKQPDIDWMFFDVGGVLTDDSDLESKRLEMIITVVNKIDSEITLDDVRRVFPEASGMLGDLSKSIIKILLKNKGEDGIQEAYIELEKIKQAYPKIESFVRKEAKNVIKSLAESYNLGIIANQPASIRDKLEKEGILKYFKNLGISREQGFHKPDPKLFEIVLSESGADPKKSVMIDDNIDRGLAPAMKFGMKTVWYDLGNRKEVPDWIDLKIKNLEDLLNIF